MLQRGPYQPNENNNNGSQKKQIKRKRINNRRLTTNKGRKHTKSTRAEENKQSKREISQKALIAAKGEIKRKYSQSHPVVRRENPQPGGREGAGEADEMTDKRRLNMFK